MIATRRLAPLSLLAAVGASGAVARPVSAFSLEARSLGMTCNRVFTHVLLSSFRAPADCRCGMTMAITPATTEYALQARANKSAKLPISAIMFLLVCRAVAFVEMLESSLGCPNRLCSQVCVLFFRTHLIGWPCCELVHSARGQIGNAIGLLYGNFV